MQTQPEPVSNPSKPSIFNFYHIEDETIFNKQITNTHALEVRSSLRVHARCRCCNKELVGFANSTSNFVQHLRSQHPDAFKRFSEEKKEHRGRPLNPPVSRKRKLSDGSDSTSQHRKPKPLLLKVRASINLRSPTTITLSPIIPNQPSLSNPVRLFLEYCHRSKAETDNTVKGSLVFRFDTDALKLVSILRSMGFKLKGYENEKGVGGNFLWSFKCE